MRSRTPRANAMLSTSARVGSGSARMRRSRSLAAWSCALYGRRSPPMTVRSRPSGLNPVAVGVLDPPRQRVVGAELHEGGRDPDQPGVALGHLVAGPLQALGDLVGDRQVQRARDRW